MNYTVEEIIESKENDWKDLTRTYFRSGAMKGYILTKDRNVPRVGDVLDGDFTEDRSGEMKFTKTKTFGAYAGSGTLGTPQTIGKATVSLQPDERENRIVRQHSQEMALRYLAIAKQTDPSLDKVAMLTDWFFDDAMGGNKKDDVKKDDDIDLSSIPF